MNLFLFSIALAQDCADRSELIASAEEAAVTADMMRLERLLADLELSFSCGPFATSEELGKAFLLEGAMLQIQGDVGAAVDDWRAAARILPSRWLEDLGNKLRLTYEDANHGYVPGRPVELSVQPELGPYVLAVDGQEAMVPADISEGLHLIQIGASAEDVRFSVMLFAVPGEPVVVAHELPNLEPTEAAEVPKEVAPQPPTPPAPALERPILAGHVAAGVSMLFEQPFENEAVREGPLKLIVPLEVGAMVKLGPIRVRAAGQVGPLAGKIAYDDGGPQAATFSYGGHFTLSYLAPQGDLGLMVGSRFPDRMSLRVNWLQPISGGPFHFETRLGGDLGPREFGPALDLLFVWAPPVVY